MAGFNPTQLGLTPAAADLFPTVAKQQNLNARAAGNYDVLAQGDQMQKDIMKRQKLRGMNPTQASLLGAAGSLGIGL